MNKVTILLVFFIILITTSNVCAKEEVIITPVPYFQRYLPLLPITTDGDSLTYSFTITNTGNKTIEGQKLWYYIRTPSREEYDTPHIDIPKLEPGKTLERKSSKVFLNDVGLYTLHFGINSHGNKLSEEKKVIVNGRDYTRDTVQHNFRVYDGSQVLQVIELVIAVLVLFTAIVGLKLKLK